ncbi:unnamed protein product [Adineta steineri]|uniref:G-protein coupled receptors family 1 profile domain-containing protein n=1 Tax=Adineta steineri TaxID=433720 RepID=A0A814B1Q1_9BILA|nr:unnamed protein product [Adineta steineri]CAF0920762.1 unnamed protein product [Adineta steineri]
MASSSAIQTILTISQDYSIVTTSIIFIFGFIGNLINIIMFTKYKAFRNNQCIFYLTVESIANIGSLILYFVLGISAFLYGFDLSQYSSIWCKLRTIIGQTLLLIVLSSVCFAAFDQYLSTNYSLYLRQQSTMSLARRLVITAISFSLFHSILFGVFFYAKPRGGCIAYYTVFIQYYSYFFYPFLCGFIPILISGSIGLLAYRNVRRIVRRHLPIVQRRLDQQLTKFVLIRVSFLIILLIPVVTYRIYAMNINIDPNNSMRLAIEKLIFTIINSIFDLNYAVNFYIFSVSSSRYRRQVKYILIKKCWYQLKRRFYFNRNQIEPSMALPIPSIELLNE